MEIAGRRREQEVWQACDDLWALSGDFGAITGDAIRERLLALGKSRGSPNEIYKYRKTWSSSRGVVKEAHALPALESDPITRAVQLVHEKLQSEAQEQIETLNSSFSETLEKHEEALRLEKENLAALLNEYSVLQQELAQQKTRIKQFEEQIAAEIDVRKATEKELAIEKARYSEQEKAHEQKIQAAESHYQQSLVAIKELYSKLENNLKSDILRLELENKTLGHQFSEKLNEVKLQHYQLEIHKKELEKNLDALNGDMLMAEQKTSAQETQIKTLLEECLKWQAQVAERNLLIKFNEAQHTALKKELKEMERALRQRDTKIARLRMMVIADGAYRGCA